MAHFPGIAELQANRAAYNARLATLNAELETALNEVTVSIDPREAQIEALKAIGGYAVKGETRGNCPKCGGKGSIREYGHVDGGVCYTCKGTGSISGGKKELTARDIETPLKGLTKSITAELYNAIRYDYTYTLKALEDKDIKALQALGFIEVEGKTVYVARHLHIDHLNYSILK